MYNLPGVKIEFIHVKTIIAHTFSVCCLFDEKTNNLVARGLAINSIKDSSSLERARTISFGRAEKAFYTMSSSGPFRQLNCKDISQKVVKKYDFKTHGEAANFNSEVSGHFSTIEGGRFEIKSFSNGSRWTSILKFSYYYPLLHALSVQYYQKSYYITQREDNHSLASSGQCGLTPFETCRLKVWNVQ